MGIGVWSLNRTDGGKYPIKTLLISFVISHCNGIVSVNLWQDYGFCTEYLGCILFYL